MSSRSVTASFMHIVWATQMRQPLLEPSFDVVLSQILGRRAAELGCSLLGVGCATDHVHVVARLAPSVALVHLVQRLKGGSAYDANHHPKRRTKIIWQRGYWAESIGVAQIGELLAYLREQRTKHDASHPAEAWQHVSDGT